ncbi:MCE family protein [Pseudonocardia endophytica]|uniref:Virulence factor Mce-like protein n=1 Tax=Pseudonocardia endophytica TaxID=401976 RepID=A0A4R1HIM4_PSEEN|nr:MCE family protein [Pseudonocardia endophytica]TCK20305.1 virulence factor Mce-like protein [Pseudonocardia endophytica]
MRSSRKVLQGLAFVMVIVGLLGLSVASYAGVFKQSDDVQLKVDRVGTQLQERADVKVRGLIVGQVSQVSTDGPVSTITMQMDPAMIDQIPSNVTARLLPKTLFGEKFVSLVPQQGPSTKPLAAGDVIDEDRSQSAREVERVLDDLLPLLQAVRPDQLASTLGALSSALQGRGDQLGRTLEQLNTLTKGLNPSVPDLQEDIRQLADFSQNLSDATPDLLASTDNLTTTLRTVVEQRDGLRNLFGKVTTASDDLRAFLDANGDNIIGLTKASRPTLETLARYSPEFPCLTRQLVDLIPKINDAIHPDTDPGVHITLEIVANKGKYLPNQDEPEYGDDRGPRCYPIPTPKGTQYPPDGPFRDGSVPGPAPEGQPMGPPAQFGVEDFGTYDGTNSFGLIQDQTAINGAGPFPVLPASPLSGTPLAGVLPGITPSSYNSSDMGIGNSPGEQQIVSELLATQRGGAPKAVPAWSTMMVAPMYRGAEVTVS